MTTKFCSPVIPSFDRVSFYMKESFETGQLANFGPAYRALSNSLLSKLEVPNRHIVLCSSGHTALMAAYAAMGIKRPLMPAFTFESTRCAATLQGIKPVLSDVDPQSGCLEVAQVEKHLGDIDSVVTVAALSSIPNLEELFVFCKENGLKLIVDGAATFGTPGIYDWADAFCMSFHATKTFSIGEGGAAIFRNKEDAKRAKSFINFGFDDNRKPVMTGINGKISEFACATGLALLEVIDEAIDKRRVILDHYRKRCSLPKTWKKDTIYQTLPSFFPDKNWVKWVKEELNNNGIENHQYYRPLRPGFPVTDNLFATNICVPAHQDLTLEQVDLISSIIQPI